MKNLSIILFLLIISCNKYENINDTRRFNRQTGETEVLSDVGEWKSIRDIKIEREEERIRQVELKKQRTNIRDSELEWMSWTVSGSYVDEQVEYIDTSLSTRGNSVVLKNHSTLEIERIITTYTIFDVSNEDERNLIETIRDTILLDVDSYLGKPSKPGKLSKEESYCCLEKFPELDEDQDYEWKISIYGFNGFDD
tara:strand:+ start:2808 stop:3395 length:588 start_codon:yes stop_codon:yes gene_type:complete